MVIIHNVSSGWAAFFAPVPLGNPVGRVLTRFPHWRTVTEAGDKSVCSQSSSAAALCQLSYSNHSAQPQQSGSSAALSKLNYNKQSAQLHNQSAQLQYISWPAAISQLVCLGAAITYFGCSVSAELQSVGLSAIPCQLTCWRGSAGLSWQPASENIQHPLLVNIVTQLG